MKTLSRVAIFLLLALEALNASAHAAQLAGATLPDTLRVGEKVLKLNGLTFIYVPGKGTALESAGKQLGFFEGEGFADAVFSIWLGPKPPSEDLKSGMLG